MKVDVTPGPTIVVKGGKVLYSRWPDGRLTRNGKRITKSESRRLEKEGR
jgi:hypothetical protein